MNGICQVAGGVSRVPFFWLLFITPGLCLAQDLPETIFDEDSVLGIDHWVLDRFAGNTRAGTFLNQGPARESGGFQRPYKAVEGEDGSMYLSVASQCFKAHPRLLKVTPDGQLHLLMETDGLVTGPLGECQGGFPIWNPHDSTLYLTGPNCLRKVVRREDGTFWVELVAGIPYTSGSDDGPALSATFAELPNGTVSTADGMIYLLEATPQGHPELLRKIDVENGMVSTLPLTRPETPGYLLNINSFYNLLSLGENDQTLYISDYYGAKGYGVVKCDLTTNTLTRVIGIPKDNCDDFDPSRCGKETDGPPLTHVGFRGGVRGIYDPFYNAIWLGGADSRRIRWQRFDGDGWVRTIFAALRPETPSQPFGVTEYNSLGNPAEQFRAGLLNVVGVDSRGGAYVTGNKETSGFFRAYNQNRGTPREANPTVEDFEPHNPNGSRIAFVRVGTDGQPLDSAMTVLSPGDSGVQENPQVAYFGGVFLVVWQDMRNGKDGDILAARVSQNGQVLDVDPLVLASAPRSQVMPDVAADDEGFMVLWQGFEGTELFPHLYAVRVGEDGSVGPTVTVTDGAAPRIAWSGTHHFVVYSTASSAGGQSRNWFRMTKAGERLAQSGRGFIWGNAVGQSDYSVCAMPPSTGKGVVFLVDGGCPDQWGHSGYAAQRAINIDAEGALMAGAPTTGAYVESRPHPAANWINQGHDDLWPWNRSAMAQDGDYIVALWSGYHRSGFAGINFENSDLVAIRLDGWKPVDPPGVVVAESASEERRPALAGNGAGNLLAVYEKQTDGRSSIASRLLKIDASINVEDEITIRSDSTGGTRRTNPAVAYAPVLGEENSVFMVVWQEGWHGMGATGTSVVTPDGGVSRDGDASQGANDAGTDTGASADTDATASGSGCGCKIGTAPPMLTLFWLAVPMLALLWRRARRKEKAGIGSNSK